MLRLLLAISLLFAPVAWAEESVAAKVDAAYRAKRQAALTGQWMEVKLPFDTDATFVARLMDTAREGDSRAMAALGWEFHQRKDDDRARTWLQRSAEGGNWFAAYLLALLQTAKDETGADKPVAEPPAVDWMQRAADEGLPEAQFEMALRFMQGKGTPLDPQTARQWYARASEHQYAPALCNLATMELQGTGGATDLKAAESHFEAAAAAGFPQGSLGLGETLRLQSRFAEASAAYERAADAGLVEADFWVGCLAGQALGQPRDEAKAAQHFVKAAEGGHLLSQAIAADLVRRGAGVPADPEAAARWDVEIAKVTNPDLLATIGTFYLEGRLVQRDLPKALGFLRAAAVQGQPVAQRWAGTLLASGEAGERNLSEAYQWLWLAARNGQSEAEPAFKAVLQAMDGTQIVEAARRAAEFQPHTP